MTFFECLSTSFKRRGSWVAFLGMFAAVGIACSIGHLFGWHINCQLIWVMVLTMIAAIFIDAFANYRQQQK